MVPFAGANPRHAARAAVLAQTLFAGTSVSTRNRIDTKIALLGGTLRATVSPERLGIVAMSSAKGLSTLLDVVVDSLTDASYPDDEVDRERELLVQQVSQAQANPDVAARAALQRHLYGDHPVARELPDPTMVATIDPAEIRGLHHTAVSPRGAALLLVGDFDLDTTLAQVQRATAAWTSCDTAHQLPSVPAVTAAALQVVNLPGAAQSHLRLAAPAVSYTDPRAAALSLAVTALGGIFSSRLVAVIREQQGYCYRVRTTREVTVHSAGVTTRLNLSMDTATDNTAAALVALRNELARFVAKPPGQGELDRARSYLLGSQLTAGRSQQHLADQLNELISIGLSPSWITQEHELLHTVTVDEIAAVAGEFLNPKRFTGVLLGDADTLAEPLSGVGSMRMP